MSPPSGTVALFQGLPCLAVDYRNVRGFGASISAVELIVGTPFSIRPDVTGERTATIARPLLINPDATISGVSIVLRPGGKGFETRITTGETSEGIDPLRTRTRAPRARHGAETDGADRAGLSG